MSLSHKNCPHSGENQFRKETAGHNNKITYECNLAWWWKKSYFTRLWRLTGNILASTMSVADYYFYFLQIDNCHCSKGARMDSDIENQTTSYITCLHILCHVMFTKGILIKMHPTVKVDYLQISPTCHDILSSISKSHGSPKTNFTQTAPKNISKQPVFESKSQKYTSDDLWPDYYGIHLIFQMKRNFMSYKWCKLQVKRLIVLKVWSLHVTKMSLNTWSALYIHVRFALDCS